MNAKVDTTRWRLRMAMRKAGLDDIVMLTRWAMQHGLDELLERERPEEVQSPPRKRRSRKRIKLNRVSRRVPRMENARVATLRKRERLTLAALAVELKRRTGGSDPNAREDICDL